MRRIKALLVILLLVFGLVLTGCEFNININDDQNGGENGGQSGSDVTHPRNTVNFFTMNDIHGQLITDEDAGTIGLDKVSTILKGLEENDDYIKITNGDMFQGSFFSNSLYGRPAIEWLNYENFDCFVIGNHEFDWGLDKLQAYKDGNLENGELNEDCEILGCNILLKSTMEIPSWIDAYSIEECNGYKVGVIGCIGEGLTSSIAASKCADYVFVDPVSLVSDYAKKLRVEEKCDVVVVSIHDYNTGTDNYRFANLSGDNRIDAIICGHTHTQNAEYLTRSDGYKIPVIQCYGNNGSVGIIQIRMSDNSPVSNGKITHYSSKSFASNKEAYDLLYRFYEDVKIVGDRVIGYSRSNLSREDLGNIACQAMVERFNVDIGICNTGGVRSAIYAGNIKYADVYKTFPFDNTVFILKMRGSDLNRFINSSLYVSDVMIENDQIYNVAIISYVYENYNGFSSNAIEATDTFIMIRDVIMDYIEENYKTN